MKHNPSVNTIYSWTNVESSYVVLLYVETDTLLQIRIRVLIFGTSNPNFQSKYMNK